MLIPKNGGLSIKRSLPGGLRDQEHPTVRFGEYLFGKPKIA